jgi:class 3 adenylate cyclase
MGIHISEIVFTDTDVFGDGVNVASRISDKATANEICISEAVFQNIRNREDLHIDLVGEMELKNVSYKLTVYKIDSSIDSEGAKIRKLAR